MGTNGLLCLSSRTGTLIAGIVDVVSCNFFPGVLRWLRIAYYCCCEMILGSCTFSSYVILGWFKKLWEGVVMKVNEMLL